jgi:hypothetical protein
VGRSRFAEDDLSAPLEELTPRQERLAQRLSRRAVDRRGSPPVLFLSDVTRSSLEGEQNALAAYGYTRDGNRGKQPSVLGLLTDAAGEPLAVRLFAGSTAAPPTVPTQIMLLQQRSLNVLQSIGGSLRLPLFQNGA